MIEAVVSISIAFIALGDQPKLSVTEIARELRSTWPDLPPVERPEKLENTISFFLGDARVIVALMRAPIPWSDLEGPCATSILWPDAATVLKQHTQHLIVTVATVASPVERSRLLTQVTAAIIETCKATLGVYWGNATLVLMQEMFREFAVKILPAPPVHMWVDFRAGRNEHGKTSGFTHGLGELGLMEIETVNSPEPPGELRERLVALAGYLIDNGLVVRDGDTVGEDANERIRVIYSDSKFGNAKRVMRLDYSSAAAQGPWWKFWSRRS